MATAPSQARPPTDLSGGTMAWILAGSAANSPRSAGGQQVTGFRSAPLSWPTVLTLALLFLPRQLGSTGERARDVIHNTHYPG